MSKTYVITGANGFIGSKLTNAIAQEDAVVYALVQDENENLSRLNLTDNVKIVYCNAADYDTLQLDNIDAFVHCAWAGAAGEGRANAFLQVKNIEYTIKAYQAAARLGAEKFISIGTVSQFVAKNIESLPNATAQNLLYGWAKQSAMNATMILSRQTKTKCVWAILANVYDETDGAKTLFNYAIGELAEGKEAKFSSGETYYAMVNANDVIKAIKILMQNPVKAESYYVGENARLLKDYLLDIGDALSMQDRIILGAMPSDGITYNREDFDTSRMKNEFGFVADYDFKAAVKARYKNLKEVKNG